MLSWPKEQTGFTSRTGLECVPGGFALARSFNRIGAALADGGTWSACSHCPHQGAAESRSALP